MKPKQKLEGHAKHSMQWYLLCQRPNLTIFNSYEKVPRFRIWIGGYNGFCLRYINIEHFLTSLSFRNHDTPKIMQVCEKFQSLKLYLKPNMYIRKEVKLFA